MIDRQAQWMRFFEAALSGTAGQTVYCENEVANNAERIVDAAMARLDARAESLTDVAAMRKALLWFADEGHYEATYRHGAGFVDACGLGKARRALGLKVDRGDGSLMPLSEALAVQKEQT